MKPALMVIDVLEEFYDISQTCAKPLKQAVRRINEAAGLFRDKHHPVVWILPTDEKEGLVPGKPGYDLSDEVQSHDGDIIIHKTPGGALARTGLAGKIAALGVDAVILTGCCAEYCVLSTGRGAEDSLYSSRYLPNRYVYQKVPDAFEPADRR